MENTTNKKQSFMAGVLTLFFAQIVIKVLGLIYRLVITNIPYFGDAGNGLYSAGYQIYTLLLAIASIGVPSAISKLVSERIAVGKHREAHEIFKTALLLFGIIGFIGSSILFFGAKYIATSMIGNPDVEGIMVALAPAVFFVAISAVIRGYFNGMYNMKVASNSQMLEQLFKSILTIGLVVAVYFLAVVNPTDLSKTLGLSTETVTVAMATAANAASTIAAAICCGYLLTYYQRSKKEIWKNINESNQVKYKKERKISIMEKILAVSIPISLASIISAINRNIDTFTVINELKIALASSFPTIDLIKNEATRLYGILSGRVDTLIGLPTALNVAFATALVPAVSETMAKGDVKTAKRRITFSIRTTLLIALPCAIGMCVLAEPILNLLFPNVYAAEAPLLLQISSFTIIFTLMNQTVAGALQGLGKVMVPAISLGCGAIIKLILNLLLIRNPQIGIYGAAISSVAASLTAMIINLVVLRNKIKLDTNKTQLILKPILATAFMGAVAFLSQYYLTTYFIKGRMATVITILLAVIAYIFAVLSFKIFDRDDYHMLPFGDKIYKFLQKIKIVKP